MARQTYGDVNFRGKLDQLAASGSGSDSQLFERTVPTTVNDCVDLGTVTTVGGAGMLHIDVVVSATSFNSTKRYEIPLGYAMTGGVWQQLVPINAVVANTSDFQLEINGNTGISTIRLRRTVGTNAGVAVVHVRTLGYSTSVQFVGSSTTTSGAAAITAVYTPALTAIADRVLAVNASALAFADPTLAANHYRVTLNQATTALRPPGAAAHVAFGPGRRNYTAASITGDLDVRAKLAPTKWAGGGTQAVVAKDGATLGWRLTLNNNGAVLFVCSVDGSTSAISATSTVGVPFANAQTGWIRVTRSVAGGTVTFYWSRDGNTWSQLGTAFTGQSTVATFDNSSIDYTLGQLASGTSSFTGDIHYVDVRSGIGGTTMLPTDPTAWNSSTSGTQTPWSAVAAPPIGTRLKLTLNQDATGGRIVTWPGNFIWQGGYAPPLSAAALAVDEYELDWDGTNWLARQLVGQAMAAAAKVDIQKFTASGTWVKPAWATQVELIAIGGGGGGGAGRRGASSSIRQGGGGGAGAARLHLTFDAADLASQLAVTIGASGIGASAQTVDSTDGAAGTGGGSTSLGSIAYAVGGPGGGGGGSGAGGVGGGANPGQQGGGSGGSASATGTAGVTPTAFGSGGGQGGGAGGGIDAGNSSYVGGGAYTSSDNPSFALLPGGAVNTTPAGPTDRVPLLTPMAGGGGPGSGSGTAAGAAGGKYGGGGGGGGGQANGNTSGGGGNGGPGIAWVISRG